MDKNYNITSFENEEATKLVYHYIEKGFTAHQTIMILIECLSSGIATGALRNPPGEKREEFVEKHLRILRLAIFDKMQYDMGLFLNTKLPFWTDEEENN